MASEAGARVVSIPWQNDFAKARNLALEQVHADWVLSLDADEQLDPSAPRLLAGADGPGGSHGVFDCHKELRPQPPGSRVGPTLSS